MKSQVWVRATIMLACLMVAAATGISLDVVAAKGQQRADAASTARTEAERQRLIHQALFEGSILEAARVNGGYFGVDFDLSQVGRGRVRTLEQLVSGAETLVVGVLSGGTPVLSANRRGVETEYLLDVSETIRGDVTGRVPLRVPGGRLVAADGAVAEVRTPGFKLEPGHAYLMYLTPGSDRAGDAERHMMVPGLMSQGIIDLTGNTVKMMEPLEVSIRGRYENRSADGFLSEVRALAHAAEASKRSDP